MSLSAAERLRLRQLEIRTRRRVQGVFAGAYESVYKGNGLTFQSVRPYVVGDDVRAMDWKVSARTGTPHIREFVEEREQTLMIVLDGSASLLFGTETRTKRDAAVELAALLAGCASVNNDRVGLMIFTDRVEHYVPPRKGRLHNARVLHDILTFAPQGQQTDLGAVLRRLHQGLRSHAIVFIVSDFMADPDSYARDLLIAGQRHDLSAFYIHDPLEQALPAVGLLRVEDAETHDIGWVDTTSRSTRRTFQQQRTGLLDARDALFQRARVPLWELPLTGELWHSLHAFFRMRQAQRR